MTFVVAKIRKLEAGTASKDRLIESLRNLLENGHALKESQPENEADHYHEIHKRPKYDLSNDDGADEGDEGDQHECDGRTRELLCCGYIHRSLELHRFVVDFPMKYVELICVL